MGTLDGATHSIHGRLVYFGAEGAGTSTNLEVLARKLKREHRGDLKAVQGDGGTWEHLPVSLGEVRGWQTSFEISSVPAGDAAEAARARLVAEADGIVFVADLRPDRHDATLAALEELLGHLLAQGRDLDEVALVVQYNHRDAVDEGAVEQLHRRLGLRDAVSFDSVAREGRAVLQSLSAVAKQVLALIRVRAETAAPEASIETPVAPVVCSVAPAELVPISGEDTVLDASVSLTPVPLEVSPIHEPRWQVQPGAQARSDGARLVVPLRICDPVSGVEIELDLEIRLAGASRG